MPVSSYVIRCRVEDQPSVLDSLRSIPGLTLGEPLEQGIPVAAESPSDEEAMQTGERLRALPGVQNAMLIYHNFEDLQPDEPDRTH